MTYTIPLSHFDLFLKCIVTLSRSQPSPGIRNTYIPESRIRYSLGYVLQPISSDCIQRLNHHCSITTNFSWILVEQLELSHTSKPITYGISFSFLSFECQCLKRLHCLRQFIRYGYTHENPAFHLKHFSGAYASLPAHFCLLWYLGLQVKHKCM